MKDEPQFPDFILWELEMRNQTLEGFLLELQVIAEEEA